MSAPWIVAFGVLAALVAVVTFVLLGVLRRCLPLLEQADALLRDGAAPPIPVGLTAGTRVPDFRVVDPGSGAAFGISDLNGRRSIVLFLGPSCPACRTLLTELEAAESLSLRCELIVVDDASPEGLRFPASAPFRVVYQDHGELSSVFETDWTPHAFAIDERGVVAAVAAPNTLAQLVQFAAVVWVGGDREPEPEWVKESPLLLK